MSRLQKKCFIGATGVHLLLVALLLVGPVLWTSGKSDATPVLEFIPMILTEANVSGGGNPRTAPAPAPTPPAPQPAPQRPEPEPPKVEKVRTSKPDPDSLDPKLDKKPHQVQVSGKFVKVPRDLKTPSKSATEAEAEATAAAKASAQRRQQFAAAIDKLKNGLTSSTKIEIPDGPNGPGGGGATYSSYKDYLKKIYFEAWRIPDDVTDDEATIKVSVTIARTGQVISSSILQSSGSKVVDKSIQATLDRVTVVRPLPEGSKDSQRTFNISFSLKAKKNG